MNVQCILNDIAPQTIGHCECGVCERGREHERY